MRCIWDRWAAHGGTSHQTSISRNDDDARHHDHHDNDQGVLGCDGLGDGYVNGQDGDDDEG